MSSVRKHHVMFFFCVCILGVFDFDVRFFLCVAAILQRGRLQSENESEVKVQRQTLRRCVVK